MPDCILCNCSMDHPAVKPTWVFDLEEGKLLGKAHATCVSKSNIPYDCSRKAIGPTPTEAQIKFAAKLYRFRTKMRRFPSPSVEFSAYLLTTHAIYHASSVEDLLASKRVKELLVWWQQGSRIITSQKAEQIVELLQTELKKET